MLVSSPRESALRIAEVRQYHATIPHIGNQSADLRGLLFVFLYGALEYTVTRVASEAISVMNSLQVKVVDLRPSLLGLVLDSHCASLKDSSVSRSWPKRVALFAAAGSSSFVNADTSILPTNGRNIRKSELETIWTVFGVQDPVLPHPRLGVRLEEVVEKQNAIAHGRESPSGVGTRYTATELAAIIDDVDLVCTHIVQSFTAYLIRGDYLR